jgi:hypothetical protein
MKTAKNNYLNIGWLFIIGAVAVLIPYTFLTMIFDYPNILRQDVGTVLTKFHKGGPALIATWFAFAITGVPLIPAYIMLGQKLERKNNLVRTATTIGMIGLIVQIIGLLRWTFVVPVLADSYVNATDEASKSAAIIAFKTIHQFGGVLLGEHLGQLFTIVWTVLLCRAFHQLKMFPAWVSWFGYGCSIIYLMAQAELFVTVIPNFPVFDIAGFLGSTLWLVWLVVIGVFFLKRQD